MHKNNFIIQKPAKFKISNFADGIASAFYDSMKHDKSVVAFGLGTTDPKCIFGTMSGLKNEFPERVYDTPISENALTGMAVGLAISGFKPVLTHQRLDFSLLSMDQIVNSAAKWHFMFGGQQSVPLVIRMIIGQGWGQGPTHSQALQSWFAQIPGLKVIMPAFPKDAYNLLRSSISDPNPVIFLEHRWLHQMEWNGVGKKNEPSPLGKSKRINIGNDITIVSNSISSVYAFHAAKILKKLKINLDVIDAYNIRDLDMPAISKSVKNTGRLLTLDFSHKFGSIGSEIITRIAEDFYFSMKSPPKRLSLPDFPVGTAQNVESEYYFTTFDICKVVLSMLNEDSEKNIQMVKTACDISKKNQFKGPF
tara:strand:- start:2152 stop:3243 length:1092 start_codon:yes stop_codon:yes gene_type:complete